MEIQNEKIELANLVFAGTLKLGPNSSVSTYFDAKNPDAKTHISVLATSKGELHSSIASPVSCGCVDKSLNKNKSTTPEKKKTKKTCKEKKETKRR